MVKSCVSVLTKKTIKKLGKDCKYNARLTGKKLASLLTRKINKTLQNQYKLNAKLDGKPRNDDYLKSILQLRHPNWRILMPIIDQNCHIPVANKETIKSSGVIVS